ncbi:hypothetical protein WBG78_06570 [Chryseolinea sp. T2]|uniref:hypothetical protein n=1 Tax=Chryseolinea sp. T2 TaxID=3129255 RepID=UPI003077E1E2
MVHRYLCAVLIVAGCIASAELCAQTKYAVGGGASWPVGSFGSKSMGDGGFATTGWSVMFEDETRFSSWPQIFSLGLHLSYQQNALDNAAMSDEFSRQLSTRTEISAARYRPLLLTFGPYFDIPITSNLDVGIKTGIGFALTNIDSFQILVYQNPNGTPLTYDVDFKSSPSFTFLLGINGEYRVTKVIGLMAYMDFSGARSQVDSFVGTVGRTHSYYDLSFINTGLGISVTFN